MKRWYLIWTVCFCVGLLGGAALPAVVVFSDLTVHEQLEYANGLELKGRDLRRAIMARAADLKRARENGLGQATVAEITGAHDLNVAKLAAAEVTPGSIRAAARSEE